MTLQSHDGHYIDRPNCEIDGQRALATNDVVIPHPADPGLFKIVGRLDDQIVLSTGEKVRPATRRSLNMRTDWTFSRRMRFRSVRLLYAEDERPDSQVMQRVS